MPKNILQDVVPPERRSIRHVTLTGKPTVPPPPPVRREQLPSHRDPPRDDEKHRTVHTLWRSRWVLWAIGAIAVAVLVVVFGSIFADATITIAPKVQVVTINLDMTAKPKANGKELSYSTLAFVREKEISVPADSNTYVETAASGKIIIYNDYSTASQRLVKNTRFETPSGLIFKIRESVTIPGRKSVNGKLLPGSVEAGVSAESAGPEYNIGLTDFTVPGFKSNPARFAAFYARSKTPMTGGFVGMTKSVSPEKLLQAKARLEGELKSELLAEARTKVPAGNIWFGDAYRLKFDTLSQPPAAGKGTVTVHESATLSLFLFPQMGIARAIAEKTVTGWSGAPVALSERENLSFSFKGSEYSPTSIGPVGFNLKGRAVLIWQTEAAKLKAELTGKSKKELPTIISHYPSIAAADVVMRPFWKSTFPSSPDKIKVVAGFSDI